MRRDRLLVGEMIYAAERAVAIVGDLSVGGTVLEAIDDT